MTTASSEQQADTVIMLSSDLIAEVMEVYFNKVMFKKKVKIVDLKPTEDGYAFSLSFIKDVHPLVAEGEQQVHDALQRKENASVLAILKDSGVVWPTNGRDNKGRFTKVKGDD